MLKKLCSSSHIDKIVLRNTFKFKSWNAIYIQFPTKDPFSDFFVLDNFGWFLFDNPKMLKTILDLNVEEWNYEIFDAFDSIIIFEIFLFPYCPHMHLSRFV